MKALELVCGDPQTVESGASFSRFVIPFPYRLQPLARQETSQGSINAQSNPILHYNYVETCPQSGADIRRLQDRRKYFTNEVEDSLFERAKWFRLQPTDRQNSEQAIAEPFPKAVKINVNDRDILMCLSAPLLVLFEFGKPAGTRDSEQSWDIFQTAFLVVELFFKEAVDVAPTLDDRARINQL